MNKTKGSANKIGWVSCAFMGGLLVWVLTGCTTYVDQSRPIGANAAPPQEEASYTAEGPGHFTAVGPVTDDHFSLDSAINMR